jgi:hypothetical protein
MSVPAPGHVGRDRDRPHFTGAGDDARFHVVVLRVQDLAADACSLQARRQSFGFGNGQRADEQRTAGGVHALDLVDERALLGLARVEDQIRMIDPHHRAVGGYHGHAQPIELIDLAGRSAAGSRHPAQPLVPSQEVLQRDRPEDAAVIPRLETLFGLERRLQTVRPVAVVHDAAGELVHDLDPAVANDVVGVAPEEHLRVQRAVDSSKDRDVPLVVKRSASERLLDRLDPCVRQLDVARVVVGRVVHPGAERGDERRQPPARAASRVDAPGNHERYARFVHQERVRFIHQREVEAAVHGFVRRHRQQIAQVVETRFLGGDVGHVGQVAGPAHGRRHSLAHEPH